MPSPGGGNGENPSALFEALLLLPRIPVQGLGDAVHPVFTPSPLREHIGKRVPRGRNCNVVAGMQFNSRLDH